MSLGLIVFSRDTLPRIKDGANAINLDNIQSKGTHWVSLSIDSNTVVYFEFFGIKYTLQEVLSKIKEKSITCKRLRIQSDDFIMCGF